MSSWEQDLSKIVNRIVSKKESEVFREPVDWKTLGITDYPMIIKKPMDLGTVQKRLDSRDYRRPEDVVADVRLIWKNAMLYNSAGSKIYNIAKSLSEYFEAQWLTINKDKDKDEDRPPSTDELTTWVDACHRITPEQLGNILTTVDSLCSFAVLKKCDTNEVELNVDLIPGRIFRELQTLIQKFIPDQPLRRKQKRVDEVDKVTQVGKKMK